MKRIVLVTFASGLIWACGTINQEKANSSDPAAPPAVSSIEQSSAVLDQTSQQPSVSDTKSVPTDAVSSDLEELSVGSQQRRARVDAEARGAGGAAVGSSSNPGDAVWMSRGISVVPEISMKALALSPFPSALEPLPLRYNREGYSAISENPFLTVSQNPLSTFSIDVDAASYSNIRRFINSNQLPPIDAVRLEEMINYFTYEYPEPTGDNPFSITSEVSEAPWNRDNRLVQIGLQGRKISNDSLPPSNLVFLIDVSGSMSSPDKLPLLKSAFRMLVNELRPEDRVAIVVYAGAAGMVLPSTPSSHKSQILDVLDHLTAGGSTAGGAGINLAYDIAHEHFEEDGNNRVILATDGDFNVGVSSDSELVRLIESKRKERIFLTVLGFGTGNLQDAKMEQLADKGNGNYAYIDNVREARKVLVNEMGGTLHTIAKDVKIQIEFNPGQVQAYRLIGYENRILAKEDFNDDRKDAGELGAGHTVTALYEVVPHGGEGPSTSVDSLKYQTTEIRSGAYTSAEMMTVKMRFKRPGVERSEAIELLVSDIQLDLKSTTENFRFASAVAEFGLLLRKSDYLANATYGQVIDLARGALGKDEFGYRAEFVRMVETAELLRPGFTSSNDFRSP
jgi:Ca-activated chloride channel homolog